MDKKNKFKNSENFVGGGVKSKSTFKEKDWYRDKIIEIVNQIESETTLKKIYTFVKTLKDILSEKEGG